MFSISNKFKKFIIIQSIILTYTCHCNIDLVLQALKDKMMKLHCKNQHFDTELLNIPECMYNYAEYQDGLVSDHFN